MGKKLPSATEILKKALLVYEKNFLLFLGIVLVPLLLTGIIMGGSFLSSFFSPKSSIISGIFVILAVIFFILQLLLQTLSPAAVICATRDREEGISVKDAYIRAWQKIIPFIWTYFLIGIIVFGGLFLLLILAWTYFLIGIIVFGGLFLLLIPALIFAVWFSFSLYILFAEDVRGMSALLKSREYVRGLWWSVLWRLGFVSLFAFLIYFLIALGSSFFIPALEDILTFVCSLLLIPLMIIYGFMLYEEVKKVKGEVVFEKSIKKKLLFIFVAFLGVVIPIAIVFILLSAPKMIEEPPITEERIQDVSLKQDFFLRSKMSQLRVAAETSFIDKEYSYYDVSCRHPEIKHICEDIKDETGVDTIIHSSESAYCAYVKFNAEEYFCIDSELNHSLVLIYPGKGGHCDGETFSCPSE